MDYPMDAEVSINCNNCYHGTHFSGDSSPAITCSGGTYKTLFISTNDGFDGMNIDLSRVTDTELIQELDKRMRNGEG